MGVIVPRPAIRARESRRVATALRRHAEIAAELEQRGIPREQATQRAAVQLRKELRGGRR